MPLGTYGFFCSSHCSGTNYGTVNVAGMKK